MRVRIMSHYILAYYLFTEIKDPKEEVIRHKAFFKGRDASSRIYIAADGINGQLSASIEDAKAYMEWMHADSRFANVKFKIHLSSENVFPRLTIKYRKQLVAMDCDADLSLGGEHVTPKQWKELLERDESKRPMVIDVRNEYEGKIGHFEGAVVPPLDTFREFPQYVEELKETVDPETTEVMMYCTGGIRCELYSALMKERGFKTVYQLDGGVIQYGLEEGSAHWKGKLFVFDDRLAVPLDDKESEPISSCHFCETKEDHYYNCANVDCNELFLSCPSCLEKNKGCCQEECQEAPRVRAYQEQEYKPFRRWHLENSACQ